MKTTTAKRVALSWLMCSTATLAYAQDDTAFDLGVLRTRGRERCRVDQRIDDGPLVPPRVEP